MAVFKNQIPILEFDSEQSAVIMPRDIILIIISHGKL